MNPRPFAPPPGLRSVGRAKPSVIVGEDLARSLRLRPGSQLKLATFTVDPDTGDGRTVSVPYFDFVATCRYSTIGTREVFPVLTLRAQSRMLVD